MKASRIVALALLAMLAAGVPVSFGQSPKYGGIYHTYWGGDLQAGGLDPARFSDNFGWTVALEIYNGLVQFDEKNAIVPDLAEHWSVSPDGRTYTFTLRKGVKFTNGRELTAADVKYSIERLYDPATKSPNTWIFEDVIQGTAAMLKGEAKELSGIRVMGTHQVRFTLEKPLAHFLALLTMPQALVLAREEVERWGADFTSHAVGTGPFMLKEWRRQDRLILEANPNYFGGKPYLAGIEYRIIPESSTAEAEFRAGRLEGLGIPDATFKQWTTDPKWQPYIMKGAEMAIYYIAFNLKKKPFDDVRVRRAIAYAIPRKQILEQVLNGRGSLAHGAIPPGLPGYNPNVVPLPYDPSKAKALLAEAGYPNGFDAELLTTPTTSNQRLFGIFQASLRGANINLKPAFRERAAYFRERRTGAFELVRGDWWADYLEAENFLTPLFRTGNYMGYSNPKVDEVIDRARFTVDPQQRIALYREAERMIIADMPWVFLYHPVSYSVYQPWVKGQKFFPTPRRTTYIWLDR